MWDLSLPGYKYLGPGNKLDKGDPTDYNDWVAYVHDLGYGQIIEEGGNPYIQFSDADEQALSNFDWSSYGGVLGKGYFSFKKKLYQTGLISKHEGMGFLDKKLKKGAHDALRKTKAGQQALGSVADNKRQKLEGGALRGSTIDLDADKKRKTPVKEVQMEADGDTVMGETTNLMANGAAQMGSGGANGTGETPVSLHVPRELGVFTETRTTYLPLRFAVSFNQLDKDGADGNTLKIRLNAPYNILRDTTFIQQTEGAATASGISTQKVQAYDNTAGLNPVTFNFYETSLVPATAPTAATAGAGVVADANCVPAWRAWYEKIYESYHTIETQYRITIVNPETTPGQRLNIYEDKDVYTTSSTGNIIPNDKRTLYMNSIWPRVNKYIVAERNNNEGAPFIKVIQGTWKPGTWSKNTLNAEDIKGWYPTGAEPSPGWVENLVIMAMNDEYNTNTYSNCQVFVELRYLVQWKDLKSSFRYVHSTNATIALNTPGDVLQIPNTSTSWGSTK